MYDEHGRDSLAPARVVEGYTFPAPAAPSSPSAQDVHPFDSNPSLPHVSPSHINELLFDSQHNPHRQLAPLTRGDWVVHVASFKDDAEDISTGCVADGEVRFARIGKSYQDGEHGARPESPTFVACQTPPSPCTLLTTCGTSLHDTTSTPERSHQDEQQQRDPNSLQYQADTMSQHVPPTLLPRAQLHRRRSSQKTALELIVEDPVGTSEMLESLERCPLRPEEEPPHANGISDTTTTAANSVPSRQGGRAPRRAFSLSDIARHSSDSLLHRDAATMALESSAIGDPEGKPSIASALEPISKLSTESGRQSVSAPIASTAEGQLAPVSKGSQHGDSVQLKASVDEELHGPSNIDVQHKSSSFSKSSASKLHPRTIAVKAASPDALASIFETSRRPDEPAVQLVTNEIVAYNPRFPHPIVLYAALSGRDTDLSAYFDENGMFADTLHRRVGAGGRQILLQDGEKVTFPSVNDEAACARQDTEKHSKRQSVSSIGDGRAGESRGQEGVEGFLWEDDYVFGNSTTSGMNFTEAMQQMNFLRDIHVTAQQSLTEDRNELLQQASNIIKNVRELQQLTEFVQARQAGSQQSPLEHDSGRETKKKGKKSRKTGPQHNESKGSNAGRSGRIQPRFTGLTFEPNLHTGLGLFFNNTTSRQRDHPNHATGPRLHSSSRSFPVNSVSPSPLELSYQQTNKYSQSYQPLPFSPFPGSPVHSYDASWSPPISPFTSTVGTFHSLSLHNMPATPTYKSDICRAYWIHGNCQYGTRCFFLHTPPSAHGSVSKVTVACLEDSAWGIHLQVYQDHHNVENLKSMLHAGVDIASSTALSAEPSITALLSQVNGASLGSNYGVMPMSGVTMVPMYPLKPAPASSISSTSLGHFIRIPFTSATQALSLRAHSSQVQVYGGHVQQRESVGIIQPKKPVQKTSKTPKQPPMDMNVRRFSTAGPLQSRKQNTYDPSIGSKVNKAYTKGSSNQANVIKRPASRSVRQVGRTILQESSIEGTRLAISGPKANGPRIADVMGQVESRLSKRMA